MDDTGRSTWQLPAGELAGSVLAVIERQRQAHAELLKQIAEVERRGIASELGFRTTVRWLVTAFRVSTAQAREWVAQAKTLYPTAKVTGGEDPARFPHITASLRAGRISDGHVRALRETLTKAAKKLPTDTALADEETLLLRLAEQAPPEAVDKAGRHLLAYLDQDGTPDTDRDNDLADPQREFHSHYDRHGWLRFTGRLDPDTAALLEGAFRELAAPQPAHDGLPDTRSPQRRRGDALAEIIGLAARTDDMPLRNGEHALITITATKAEIESDSALLFVDGPGFRTSSAIKRMCCGASRMVAALLGPHGELLNLGRTVRNATPAQRRALALRDKGCTFPGCTRSPKWCVPHHVRHWEHHGPTDLDNLALLCESHHRLVHHAGWTITMTTGTPRYIAPGWLDPT
ncbi:HNH endonuclease signature motif containing protein, partial [Amycolatopsis palatopharyngis]|uniref:HNH endonuclease signature motif containing protein n=1 Tax=Amycolatopsis palatopharyngis TaxID=187982 RepID=UPI0013BE9BF2